jgi:hypothetical protein
MTSHLSSLPGVARAQDWTHSLPAIQLRVAQNAEVDFPLLESWMQQKDRTSIPHPFTANMHPETLGVVANEICMRQIQVPVGGDSRIYKKQRREELPSFLTPLFTNLNGMPISMDQAQWDKLTPEEKQAWIHAKYPVGGIVGTTREWDDYKKMGRTDFANQIGGIYGIINTGPKNIYAGQLVMANAPLAFLQATDDNGRMDALKKQRNITGTSKDKVLLETVPYDPTNVVTTDSIKNLIGARGGFGTAVGQLWPKPPIVEGDDIYVLQNMVQDLMLFAMHVNAVVNTKRAGAFDANVYNNNMQTELTGTVMDDEVFRYIFDPESIALQSRSNNADGFNKVMVEQTRSLMPRLLNSYYRIMRAYNSRILGVALTDALSGGQFDIKQGSQIA